MMQQRMTNIYQPASINHLFDLSFNLSVVAPSNIKYDPVRFVFFVLKFARQKHEVRRENVISSKKKDLSNINSENFVI